VHIADGQLSKDKRFAGLNSNAGKVEASPGAGEGRLNEIEFARGNAS
jgi:hypothetical protein